MFAEPVSKSLTIIRPFAALDPSIAVRSSGVLELQWKLGIAELALQQLLAARLHAAKALRIVRAGAARFAEQPRVVAELRGHLRPRTAPSEGWIPVPTATPLPLAPTYLSD